MTQETNRTAARLLGLQPLKDARLRLNITLLLVMTALLAAPIEAEAYTVTLTSGEGSGSDIVLDSDKTSDNVGVVEDWVNAPQGKFYTYKGNLEFKVPGCPDTFTSPSDLKKFAGWQWNNYIWRAGNPISITGDVTLTAYWNVDEFNMNIEEGSTTFLTFRVNSTSPNEVEIIGSLPIDEPDLIIPSTVKYNKTTYAVTGIGSSAISNQPALESVKIPATVRYIGERAFENCLSLTSVEIGSGTRGIGESAFAGCNNLTVTFHNFPTLGSSCLPESTTLRLLANKASDDAYWATFYCENETFLFDDKTTVYWATLDGMTLKLHEVEDRIVDGGTAVILKSTQEYLVMSFTGDECKDWGIIWDNNSLWGLSERTLRNNLEEFNPDEDAIYVLGKKNDEVGFYEYTGEYVPAGKAFVVADKITNGARGFTFAYDETTKIVELKNSRIEELKSDDAWYSIDGRRLSSKPMAKGVYIVDGKKVVIK